MNAAIPKTRDASEWVTYFDATNKPGNIQLPPPESPWDTAAKAHPRAIGLIILGCIIVGGSIYGAITFNASFNPSFAKTVITIAIGGIGSGIGGLLIFAGGAFLNREYFSDPDYIKKVRNELLVLLFKNNTLVVGFEKITNKKNWSDYLTEHMLIDIAKNAIPRDQVEAVKTFLKSQDTTVFPTLIAQWEQEESQARQ